MNVVILILSCGDHRETRQKAVRQTWCREIPDNVSVFFVEGGHVRNEVAGDRILLACGDSYADLARKTYDAFRVLADGKDFDFLLKCDDDTYVDMRRLLRLIDTFDDHTHYAGSLCHGGMGTSTPYAPGAGYVLSRFAMRLVSETPFHSDAPSPWKWYGPRRNVVGRISDSVEDMMVGCMLHAQGIRLKVVPGFSSRSFPGPNIVGSVILCHRITPERMVLLYEKMKSHPNGFPFLNCVYHLYFHCWLLKKKTRMRWDDLMRSLKKSSFRGALRRTGILHWRASRAWEYLLRPASDMLFVFVHIPKTGGMSIIRSVRDAGVMHEGITTEECLGHMDDRFVVNYDEFFREFFPRKTSLWKRGIRILWGHHVAFAISKSSFKPVRYFTFMRDPLDLHISRYNYHFSYLKSAPNTPAETIDRRLAMSVFMPEGVFLDFNEYVDRLDDANIMCRFLFERGFLSSLTPDANAIADCLNRFFFIGLQETHDEDQRKLAFMLGIPLRPHRENVSVSSAYARGDNSAAESRLLAKIPYDSLLYSAAKIRRDSLESFSPSDV